MDDVVISTDKARLDHELIFDFLHHRSYWCPGVAREVVERSIENSLCFGIYRGDAQLGFARVVTDRATFAYLADVFVLESERGQGLSKRLVATIVAHPDVVGVRRFMLATLDAHGLYRQFGFATHDDPNLVMSIVRPVR